jgi:uncharacterized protein YneF (UPF0154 family)
MISNILIGMAILCAGFFGGMWFSHKESDEKHVKECQRQFKQFVSCLKSVKQALNNNSSSGIVIEMIDDMLETFKGGS